MRNINTEVNALRAEYHNADRRRQNEIFESLSHYARKVCQSVYNNLKQEHGDLCKYDECLMTAYEKLHKVLLTGATRVHLYDAIYKACYRDIEIQCKAVVAEQEFIKENNLVDVSAIADEENWDDINEGKRIWEKILKYDSNETRKNIMKLYFGFDGNNPHIQAKIARMLNISKERVRRVVSKYGIQEAIRVANLSSVREEVLKCASKGKYSNAQLALKFKLSPAQVGNILKGQNRILKPICENNEI